MLDIRGLVEREIARNKGILHLKPTWVPRTFISGGSRLGLKEKEYNLGNGKGWISERWFASITKSNPPISSEDEGLSYLDIDDSKNITLKDAVEFAGELIMGKEYAKSHNGLERLAKMYDYDDRAPLHIHQMKKHANLVNSNPKEEAYYFPEGVDLGPHPETFFGVHPYISEQKKYDILLPYLIDWNSDLILQHSRAYKIIAGEGFHVPAGILHAPGTALTIELQEDSDVLAFFQAMVGGKIVSKDLLFKDVRREDREKYGERYILEQVDWEASGDPYFYENHRTYPQLIKDTKQEGGEEYWIYYNTKKFSGKKLIVKPGKSYFSQDKGVYNLFILKGEGTFDGHKIKAGNFGQDELLITYERAVKPLKVNNTGKTEMEIIKFFGPDINNDSPIIKKYKS